MLKGYQSELVDRYIIIILMIIFQNKNSIYDKFTQFALIATKQAVSSSGIEFKEKDSSKIGVILGTAGGGLQTQDENYRQVYEKVRIEYIL